MRLGHEQRPLFSFEYADRGSPHLFHFRPNGADALKILELVCEMSQLSWREITRQQFHSTGSDRAKHHEQAFESLSREAQRRLRECNVHERADELFRFRLGNLPRLWGLRAVDSDPTFYVLWWDPLHKVDGSSRG